jgi:hypothetical protein
VGDRYVRAGRILTGLGLMLAACGVTAAVIDAPFWVVFVLAAGTGNCLSAGVRWWVVGRADQAREREGAVTGG